MVHARFGEGLETIRDKRRLEETLPSRAFTDIYVDIVSIGEQKIQVPKTIFERMVSECKVFTVASGAGPSFAEFLSLSAVQELIIKNGIIAEVLVQAVQRALNPDSREAQPLFDVNAPLKINIDPKTAQGAETSFYGKMRTPEISAFEGELWAVFEDVRSKRLEILEGKAGVWEKALGQRYISKQGKKIDRVYYPGEIERADVVSEELKKRVDKFAPPEVAYKYHSYIGWALEQGKEVAWTTLGLISELLDVREKAGKKGESPVELKDFFNLAYELRMTVYAPLRRGEMTYGVELGFNPITYGAVSVYAVKQWADKWQEYGVNLYLQPVGTGDVITGVGLSLRKFAFNVPLFNLSNGALPFEKESFQGYLFGFGGIGFGVVGGEATFFAGAFTMPLKGVQKGQVSFISPIMLVFYGINAAPEAFSTIKAAELGSVGAAGAVRRLAELIVPTQTIREIINIFDLLIPNISKDETSYYQLKRKISETNALLSKGEYNDALAILRDMFDHSVVSAVANPFVKGYLNFLLDKAIEREILHVSGGNLRPSENIHDRGVSSMGQLEKLVEKCESGAALTSREHEMFFSNFSYLLLKTAVFARDGQIFDISPAYLKTPAEYGRYARVMYGASFYFNALAESYANALGEREKERFSFGLMLFAEAGLQCNPVVFVQHYDLMVKKELIEKDRARGAITFSPEVLYYMLDRSLNRSFVRLPERMQLETTLVEIESSLAGVEKGGIALKPEQEALESYYKGGFDILALKDLSRYAVLYQIHTQISGVKDYAIQSRDDALLRRLDGYEKRLMAVIRVYSVAARRVPDESRFEFRQNPVMDELALLRSIVVSRYRGVGAVERELRESVSDVPDIKPLQNARSYLHTIWKQYEKTGSIKGYTDVYAGDSLPALYSEENNKGLDEAVAMLEVLGAERHLLPGRRESAEGETNSKRFVLRLLALPILVHARAVYPDNKVISALLIQHSRELDADIQSLGSNFVGFGAWDPQLISGQVARVARAISTDIGLSEKEMAEFTKGLPTTIPPDAIEYVAGIIFGKVQYQFGEKAGKLRELGEQLEERRRVLEDIKARIEYKAVSFSKKNERENMLERLDDAINKTKALITHVQETQEKIASEYARCLSFYSSLVPFESYRYYLSSIGVHEIR